MSNILPTVGRNVQYVNAAGTTKAAVITDVLPDGTVSLYVMDSKVGAYFASDIKEYNAQAREVVNVYKLTWLAR